MIIEIESEWGGVPVEKRRKRRRETVGPWRIVLTAT